MTESPIDIQPVQQLAAAVRENVARVIVGKAEIVDLLLVALLCEGHVLLEDVPGIGKTTLAKTLARSLGGSFQRIQFTPDLLPSDITGVSIFNQQKQEFEYRSGPLMAQIVLADEINRAGPRTQSALRPCLPSPRNRRLPPVIFRPTTQSVSTLLPVQLMWRLMAASLNEVLFPMFCRRNRGRRCRSKSPHAMGMFS